MNTIKSIAITLASLLGATVLAGSAAVVYESKKCEEPMQWARRDLSQFDENITSVHRIWDKATKLGAYGIVMYGKELTDARAEVDESNKEVGWSITRARRNCNPYSPGGKLAVKLNPRAFDTSKLVRRYDKLLDEYNNKDWSYGGVIPGKPLASPSEVVPPVQSDPITRQNCARYLTATECGQRF